MPPSVFGFSVSLWCTSKYATIYNTIYKKNVYTYVECMCVLCTILTQYHNVHILRFVLNRIGDYTLRGNLLPVIFILLDICHIYLLYVHCIFRMTENIKEYRNLKEKLVKHELVNLSFALLQSCPYDVHVFTGI